MILIEDINYKTEKYCTNCNEPNETTKAIKISVKNNNCSFLVVCLCGACRKELQNKLKESEG